MQVTKRMSSVLLIFVCLLALQACAYSKYRRELEAKRIPYTADAYFTAVNNRDNAVVRLFVLGGFNVNACMEAKEGQGDRQTAMHAAIWDHDTKMVAFLLEHGYNLNQETCQVKTPPLHLAAMRGLVDIVKLMIEHGADINRKDTFGMTPLMLAQQMRRPVMANFLRSQGAK